MSLDTSQFQPPNQDIVSTDVDHREVLLQQGHLAHRLKAARLQLRQTEMAHHLALQAQMSRKDSLAQQLHVLQQQTNAIQNAPSLEPYRQSLLQGYQQHYQQNIYQLNLLHEHTSARLAQLHQDLLHNQHYLAILLQDRKSRVQALLSNYNDLQLYLEAKQTDYSLEEQDIATFMEDYSIESVRQSVHLQLVPPPSHDYSSLFSHIQTLLETPLLPQHQSKLDRLLHSIHLSPKERQHLDEVVAMHRHVFHQLQIHDRPSAHLERDRKLRQEQKDLHQRLTEIQQEVQANQLKQQQAEQEDQERVQRLFQEGQDPEEDILFRQQLAQVASQQVQEKIEEMEEQEKQDQEENTRRLQDIQGCQESIREQQQVLHEFNAKYFCQKVVAKRIVLKNCAKQEREVLSIPQGETGRGQAREEQSLYSKQKNLLSNRSQSVLGESVPEEQGWEEQLYKGVAVSVALNKEGPFREGFIHLERDRKSLIVQLYDQMVLIQVESVTHLHLRRLTLELTHLLNHEPQLILFRMSEPTLRLFHNTLDELVNLFHPNQLPLL